MQSMRQANALACPGCKLASAALKGNKLVTGEHNYYFLEGILAPPESWEPLFLLTGTLRIVSRYIKSKGWVICIVVTIP